MNRYSQSLILALGLSSAAAAQGATTSRPAKPATKPAAKALGPVVPMLPMSQLGAIAGRVGSLRVVPATLPLRVGQTVEFDSIQVIAVDTRGQDIGRLNGFDFGIKAGEPAVAVPRKVTGIRAGTTELRVRYPSAPWGTRVQERPFAIIKVVVKP